MIEHASILEPLRALAKEGLLLTELTVGGDGRLDLKTLREAVTPETVLVSIQMINSEIGTIQDIREIAKEVRQAKRNRENADALPLYLHTDASQAPLWLPLSVEKLGVDLMTLDAQKMMGPKGAGVLYIKRGTKVAPYIYGGGQERGLRSGTENVALAGAFAVALAEAQAQAEAASARIAPVRDLLIAEIQKKIPGATLNGGAGEWRVANNSNVSIPKLNGDMAVIALDAEGIAASTRSACDTEDEVPSHVLSAIGVSPEHAKESIRLTLLPTATRSEAKRIATTLVTVARRYATK
jgi:cysteine desulfurase